MFASFSTSLLLGLIVQGTGISSVGQCLQEFRKIDDQADSDVRDINRRIALIEDETRDRAIASGGPDLQARLDAAKLRRSGILDKQHDDLNAVRAQCDRLRDQHRQQSSESGGPAGSQE